MMRNILYICLLSLLAISCEKKESFLYEETNGLYSILPGAAEKPWTSGEPDKMNTEINFPLKENGKTHPQDYYPLVYGNTPRTDSIMLVIAVAGELSDQPRDYYLKVEALNDTIEVADIRIPEVCTLKANALTDTVKVYINSPRELGTFVSVITFDTEKSKAFPATISGWDKYEIRSSNRYPRPADWSDAIYGPYSEEKYAFMVEVLQTSYQYYSWIMDHDNWTMSWGLPELIEALQEYNAQHPDAPKDFTFPGM